MRRIIRVCGLAISIFVLGLGAWNQTSWAQDGPQRVEVQERASRSGWVVTLTIGRLGQTAQAYEIGRVANGPPPEDPEYIDVDGLTLGVAIGLLDREQQVVEVHLFRAAGEAFAQLLIEPGVNGYADHDESTALEVQLDSIGRGRSE